MHGNVWEKLLGALTFPEGRISLVMHSGHPLTWDLSHYAKFAVHAVVMHQYNSLNLMMFTIEIKLKIPAAALSPHRQI